MNFAHDNTVVDHELGHSITPRYTSARPSNWCDRSNPAAICPTVNGWGVFHELADFWGDHWESTNCAAGWVARERERRERQPQLRASRRGGIPAPPARVAIPEQPGDARGPLPRARVAGEPLLQHADRHGDPMAGPCGDAQPQHHQRAQSVRRPILGGAQGRRPVGFHPGVQRPGGLWAARGSGAVDAAPMDQSTGRLHHLGQRDRGHERHPHPQHQQGHRRLRAGRYLCHPVGGLDGNPGTLEVNICPTGENGADAAIDLVDNVASDDVDFRGVPIEENDYVRRSGPPPTFRVWTGARYRFDSSGNALLTGTAPCRTANSTSSCRHRPISRPSTCRADGSRWIATFRPAAQSARPAGRPPSPRCDRSLPDDWGRSSGFSCRIRTSTTGSAREIRPGGSERNSLSPGNGTWSAAAPFFVINLTGRPGL